MIPQYKDTINTPYKSKQEQENDNIDKIEMKNKINNYELLNKSKQQSTPLFKLEINEPKMPKLTDEILPPYIFGQNPLFPTQLQNPNPFNYPNNMYQPMTPYPYVIKKNIINLNPVTDFTQAADIYEDILPNNLLISNNSFSTLSERKNISEYIRGIFIKNGDGEEVSLGKLNKGIASSHNLKNLLSHIKLLEINPYHFNKLTTNPYKTMPLNFCMYRSCYPIKLNEFNSINCAKSNIGINVRIYGLTNNDYINNKMDIKQKTDVWRELEYYKYIKQEVINNNKSPNFIQIHAYYRAKNIGINFNNLKNLREFMPTFLNKENYKENQIEYQKNIMSLLYGDTENIKKLLLKNDIIDNSMLNNDLKIILNNLYNDNKINNFIGNQNYNDLNDDNIIILSEAPTHNIINWASKSYELSNTPIKKMIQSGYHSVNEWESILFQLLISIIILFQKKIVFTEFNLEYNVYIKDLQNISGTNIGYWKYIINNIEYRVPNYGYLVLIDSSYKDLSENNNNYKILCDKWGDDLNDIIKITEKNMLNIFNTNNFTTDFIRNGGQISSKIKELIDNINKIIRQIFSNIERLNPIDKYNKILNDLYDIPIKIITKFGNFNYLHNKLGTIVPINEQNMLINLKYANIRKINIGELVSISINNDLYKYCIFIKYKDSDVHICELLTTSDTINNKSELKRLEIIEININNVFIIIGNLDENYEVGKNNSEIETYFI